jgi:hypothetical protein
VLTSNIASPKENLVFEASICKILLSLFLSKKTRCKPGFFDDCPKQRGRISCLP